MCVCEHIHFAFVHMFKTGGCSHTHTQERKCQCSTSCVSGSVSAAVARHRAGRQTAPRCATLQKAHEIMVYSLLCLTLHSPPSPSLTQIQVSPPLPLYKSLLCKGTPATYRTESIPLHTGWVPHWPPGLMKKPLQKNSPPSSLHPITYRKGFYLTLGLLLLFVFTTLPPSSVALPLRCGWLLWSGPAL